MQRMCKAWAHKWIFLALQIFFHQKIIIPNVENPENERTTLEKAKKVI